jgi:cytosine/adenosine deaminase-related metal-dependent hydrolase
MANQPRTATLFKNATVVSMDASIGLQYKCDVLVEENKITKVEADIRVTDTAETEIIDASSSILCPGFIDCHHHMWQQLLRTVATDWSLADYLAVIRNCYGSLFTPDDVYISNYIACLDLFNHAHIRGVFCYGFYDNPPLPSPHASISTADPNFTGTAKRDDARRTREQHFPGDNSWDTNLLTFGLAPNEFEATPLPMLQSDIDFGRSLNSTIITGHVGMGHYDLGAQVVQNLADTKYLAPDLLFSHGAAWTDSECDALAHHKSGVVSTPDTDLQMGMGHPIAFKARDHGCRVGLGIDVTCNQGNDMVQQARLLLQAERAKNNAEMGDVPIDIKRTTEEALRMITLGGAEALGIEHLVGSITPGKRADLVVIKCDKLNIVPVVDPIGTIVLNSNNSNISDVMVDGRWVKRKGEVIAIGGEGQWEKMREDMIARTKRLVKSADDVMPRDSRKAIATAVVNGWREAVKGEAKL